ncbi:MAG: hypothetical protein AB1641_29615 [Thermodesulfobacteriota bacterium]
MRLLKLTLMFVIVILLAGCANFNSIFREINVNEGKGALVDIKQRAVIVTQKNDGTKSKTIVCAEPSPEALSAYASQIAAEAKLPESVAVQLALAAQESSSFTGLRTQSIQLLRDLQYRLCEAYSNGAIDEVQYGILLRRSQKYMVAILAIEQLTGTLRSPAVTVNTEGQAVTARSISEIRTEIEAIDAKIKELESKKKTDGDEFDKKLKSLQTDKEALEKGIENAKGLLVSGKAIAAVQMPPEVMLLSKDKDIITQVASVVNDIVYDIINSDDLGQLCVAYLSKDTTKEPLRKICGDYISNFNLAAKVKIEALQIELEEIKTARTITDEKVKEINKKIKDIGSILMAPSRSKPRSF